MHYPRISVAFIVAVLSAAAAPAAEINLPPVPHYILVPQSAPEPVEAPRYMGGNENSDTAAKTLVGRGEVTGSFVWKRFLLPHYLAVVLTYLLGFVILLLTVLAVLLWRMIRRNVHVAERALIELERPFLHVDVTKPGVLVTTNRSARGVFEVSVFNLGRTPATLTHLEYNLILVDQDNLADPIDPQYIAGYELPAGTISALNHPYIVNTEMHRLFDKEVQITDGRLSVWLIGFVRYHNIFGEHYITGFAKVFDRSGGIFIPRGDAKYNYTRNDVLTEIPRPRSPCEDDRHSLATSHEEILAADAQLELLALPKLSRDSSLASC